MQDTSSAHFIQGVYHYTGHGLDKPVPLLGCRYVVPPGATAQPVYFRGGNSADDMICVTLMRDGETMRLFPLGAKNSCHVSLRVVEDLLADTVLELHVAAPDGCAGTVVVDLGLVEV